jgi:hypothetical protein
LAGIEKVAVPRNSPVSNWTPPTDPGVNMFGAASLVTECWTPSRFTTVTVEPAGTCRLSGEKAIPEMVMVGLDVGADGVAGVGAGAAEPLVELPPHPATTIADAAAQRTEVVKRMLPPQCPRSFPAHM